MALLTTNKTTSKVVNTQEVWSLWDMLSAKYQFLEKLHLWQNFIHDKSLQQKFTQY